MSTESPRSRLPQYNSVESSTAEISESEESRSYEDEVADRASECVDEFREQYPHLAEQPMSQTPGRPLREELVEEEYVEECVEPENEYGQGFTVPRRDRAEPVTWAEGLFMFLVTRQPYDDGVAGRFRDTATDEIFTQEFHDCWTTAYGEEQAARNSGAQRQLMGGAYPEDNEESARAGEFEGDHEWSGDTATIMLTRTGSSTPGGKRLPPIDHADQVARTWSQGGVYDTVRNICEYELGLDSSEWGYVRGDDVHGMGPVEGQNPGENACYVHSHDAVYIDVGATDLRETFGADFEIKSVLENQFFKAIQKHVESCDVAEAEAHTKEKAIEVRLDLENPAGYATEYLRLDENEMMEMPVEFQAFAAVEWGTNRQRIARSQVFTEAAKADLCKQDPEVEHGERLTYDRSGHGDPEIVCAHCGSGVGVDVETIVEYRVREGFEWLSPWVRQGSVKPSVGVESCGVWEAEGVVRAQIGGEVVERPVAGQEAGFSLEGQRLKLGGGDDWCPACKTENPESDYCSHEDYREHPIVEAQYGAGLTVETGSGDRFQGDGHARVEYEAEVGELDEYYREQVEQVIDVRGGVSAAVVMGELGIPLQYRDVVEEVCGEGGGGGGGVTVETEMGVSDPGETQYQLEAIVMPDGGEEEVSSPGGGGVDMVALELPEERLLRETRLQYYEWEEDPGYWENSGEVEGRWIGPLIEISCSEGEWSTSSPEAAAGWLVEHGYRKPWHAELALSFENRSGKLPAEFEEPAAKPPSRNRD